MALALHTLLNLGYMRLVLFKATVRRPIRYVTDGVLHSWNQVIIALDFLDHVVWAISWFFYVLATYCGV